MYFTMNKFKLGVSIISVIASISCFGQNSTYSPYSFYGIGEFETSDFSRMAGAGGVGIGVNTKGFLNVSNPASYSSIDSLNFLFDVSFSGKMSRFESSNASYRTINGNLKKIAIGFRLLPIWSLSAGVVPYTNVGYKTITEKDIEGAQGKFTIEATGSGGLSKLYLGNSFRLTKKLSVGVNTNLIIGYFEKKEVYMHELLITSDLLTRRKFKPSSAYSFDFGAQYTDSLNSTWRYTLGLVGGLSTKLKFLEYSTHQSSLYDNEDKYEGKYDFWIPPYIGGGLSVSSTKWSFASDYKLQYWESVKDENKLALLTNTHHFAIGAQYCPRPFLGKNIFELMSYQFGFHFDRSYLKVKDNNFDMFGVTAGVLIPIKNKMTVVGLSVDMGQRGRLTTGMFKEEYIQFNLTVNFADIWFQKRKFY